MATDSPYGKTRVLAGLKHLLLGKALASIGGIGTLFFVVRGLSVAEFAAYSVLFGLVELAALTTSLGANHILGRFVPELYAVQQMSALRRVVFGLTAYRTVTMVLLLAVMAWFAAPLTRLIGIADWNGAYLMYLWVVLFRGISQSLFTVLEAMLHQRIGQLTFAGTTVSRFVIVALLYATGRLDLDALIVAEIVTEAVCALVMLVSLARLDWTDPVPEPAAVTVPSAASAPATADGATAAPARPDGHQWLRQNRRRMVSYGWKGYVQHLIIVPFSGMVNRLIVGGSRTGAGQVAQFGFAQSIYDLVQRYLPAQLFQGVIRPVMVARYSSGRDPAIVVELTNTCLKVNLMIIGALVVGLCAGGPPMLGWVTAGKQGQGAWVLLLLMMTLVALDSWRHVLDILCQTVERFGFLIVSNTVLATSLIAGLMLMPRLGPAALPIANGAGLIVANLLVQWWLRRTGFAFRLDTRWIGAIVLVVIGLSCVLLAIAQTGWLPWGALVAMAELVYVAIVAAFARADAATMNFIATLRNRGTR